MDYVTSFAKAASIGAIGVVALLFAFRGLSGPDTPAIPTGNAPIDAEIYHDILRQLKPDWRTATAEEDCQARLLSQLEQKRLDRLNTHGDGTVRGEDVGNAILIMLACKQNPSL